LFGDMPDMIAVQIKGIETGLSKTIASSLGQHAGPGSRDDVHGSWR
jgi:hypothetical protein